MRVVFVGVRGIPGVQGGVETHVEHLGKDLVSRGWDVEVVTRSPYVDTSIRSWNGLTLRPLWAPKIKGVEALLHTIIGVLYAAVWRRPDLVHIHAVGPALATPVARCLGLRVVFTHHGRDYDREKWGTLARWILRAGEYMGVRLSHECIAISKTIQADVRKRLGREPYLIRNGVLMPSVPNRQDALRMFGLDTGRYILMVARFVPEKRQLDLIRAFQSAAVTGWRLVLVGDLGEGGHYVEEVREAVAGYQQIVLTGFQQGETLHELYGHAGLFVLPSSHEGLPIVLLEALSYGLPVLASDIPANKEVGLEERQYFPVRNVNVLKERLQILTKETVSAETRTFIRERIAKEYNWVDIGRETERVYLSVIGHTEGSLRPNPDSTSKRM